MTPNQLLTLSAEIAQQIEQNTIELEMADHDMQTARERYQQAFARNIALSNLAAALRTASPHLVAPAYSFDDWAEAIRQG